MSAVLRPLRDDEFDDYVARGKVRYAEDMIENAGMAREDAEAKSDRDWKSILPNRLDSEGQYIYAVEDAETGERVGELWFAKREADADGLVAFVYSIEIFETFRGRGFGKEAMLLFEDEARKLGLTKVALNVFGGNEVARSLYRSIGYAETSIWMNKTL